MLVKVAALGERVVEVNVEQNTPIEQVLAIAGVIHNGREVRINNAEATLSTPVVVEGSLITLASKAKGG